MSSPTHVLYIDDSGTKDYAADPANYNVAGRGSSRYFVFCGILVTAKVAGILSSEIIRLKLDYFGSDSVEIKSNWLRQPLERRVRYLEPFDLAESGLRGFVDDLYTTLANADMMLIASVVDKAHMQEDYPRPWYAPAVAYETLLLRVQGALTQDDKVAVIIDDTTGKTPKGNDFKANLKKHHAQLRKSGSSLKKSVQFPSLTTQSFVGSHVSHLVQAADVCAYNVHRQFQMYADEWENPSTKTLPMYEHFKRLRSKFRTNGAGRIQGYGIVKMPQRNKILWGHKTKQ